MSLSTRRGGGCGGGVLYLYKLYKKVCDRHKGYGCVSRFGLKTGMDFAHSWPKIG